MRRVSKVGLVAATAGSVAAFVVGDAYVATLTSIAGTWVQNLGAALQQMPAHVLENGPISLESGPVLAGFVCAVAVWLVWSQYVLAAVWSASFPMCPH